MPEAELSILGAGQPTVKVSEMTVGGDEIC